MILHQGKYYKHLSARPGCQPKALFALWLSVLLPSRDSPSAPTMCTCRRQGLLTCAVKASSHLSGGSKCRTRGPHAKWQQQRLESLSPWSPCPMPTATAQMSFLPPGGAGSELLGTGWLTPPWDNCTTPVANQKKEFLVVWLFISPPPASQPRNFMSCLTERFPPEKIKDWEIMCGFIFKG